MEAIYNFIADLNPAIAAILVMTGIYVVIIEYKHMFSDDSTVYFRSVQHNAEPVENRKGIFTLANMGIVIGIIAGLIGSVVGVIQIGIFFGWWPEKLTPEEVKDAANLIIFYKSHA